MPWGDFHLHSVGSYFFAAVALAQRSGKRHIQTIGTTVEHAQVKRARRWVTPPRETERGTQVIIITDKEAHYSDQLGPLPSCKTPRFPIRLSPRARPPFGVTVDLESWIFELLGWLRLLAYKIYAWVMWSLSLFWYNFAAVALGRFSGKETHSGGKVGKTVQ